MPEGGRVIEAMIGGLISVQRVSITTLKSVTLIVTGLTSLTIRSILTNPSPSEPQREVPLVAPPHAGRCGIGVETPEITPLRCFLLTGETGFTPSRLPLSSRLDIETLRCRVWRDIIPPRTGKRAIS